MGGGKRWLNGDLCRVCYAQKQRRNCRFCEAQALVAKLQAHITANYYTCTDEILAGLGKMYVADERFKKNIDKYGEGTAEFVSEGISIYVEKK